MDSPKSSVPSKPPTIRMVALKAGVSRTAVSLALRNHSRIPLETRNRIHMIARQMGYRINPSVSLFMAKLKKPEIVSSTATIAYLTAREEKREGWQESLGWQKSALQEIYNGAFQRAEQLSYRLETFYWNEHGMTGKRLSKILYARNIHGLIIAPLPRPKGHLPLDWSLFATTVVGYSFVGPNLHRVSKDDFSNTLLALRTLRRLGYRRVGLALSSQTNSRVDFRYAAAYMAYHQHLNIKHIPPFITGRLNSKNLIPWYRKNRPDVIITTEYKMQEWLQDAGIRIPKDLGFVNIDRQPENQATSGVDFNPHMVGAACIDTVEIQLNQNERGIPVQPKLVLIPGRWRDGATVRKQ